MWANGGRPGKRVLVIDDEPLIRWSLAETLGAAGCDVRQAGDGGSAERMLLQLDDEIDVVLLDYRLPGVVHLQLLSRIRALAPHARIILMTAYGSPEMTREALASGAERVIQKPFDMRTLRMLVEQMRSPEGQER
jgi:DNA-binding NtrC family response regulator